MEHTLIVAGIGPGDPDYILPKAQKAIEGRITRGRPPRAF